MKLNKERRDRLILVAIVTVALCAAVWQLFIKTGMQRLAAAQSAAATSLEEYRKAEAFMKQAAELELRAQEASNRLVALEAEMAHPADLLAWSFDLMKRAGSAHSGVAIEEVVAPRAPATVQMIPSFPYRAMSFTVRGKAYFQDLGAFLADFENTYPYYRTENLELRVARDALGTTSRTNRGKIEFKVDFVTLVRPTS